jgi:hypothetical protein
MTTFPRSPRLIKGAIVGIEKFNPLASVIIFQYNPETLTRTLTAQPVNKEGGRSEPMILKGPPEETIKFTAEIDATDQLEKADVTAVTMGILPQLAALEMLLYPKSSEIIRNTILKGTGAIEMVPTEAPFTLFIWGWKRVLPVRLTGFTITEKAYDPNLNPILAEVTLDLRVLSYSDLPEKHEGGYVFLVHQIAKEAMAVIGSVSNISAVAGGNVKLF